MRSGLGYRSPITDVLDGIGARAHPTRGSRAGLSVEQMLNLVIRMFG
jgi:hypothetical protein